MDEQFDPVKQLWREQGLEELQRPAMKQLESDFRKIVTRRNWIEWTACAVVVIVFGRMAFVSPHLLTKLGALELIVAAIYIAWRLRKDGRVPYNEDPTLSTVQHLAGHRSNLLAQARFLRRVPLWYLAPIVVGWSLIWTSRLLVKTENQDSLTVLFVDLVGSLIFFGAVGWLNVREAVRFEKKAEELAGSWPRDTSSP